MPALAAIQRRETIKIGRKAVAEVLTHKNGHKIMIVNRTMKDIVRGRDNKMISHGMETDEACWPVESLLLSRMRLSGVNIIGIRIRSTKALYLSRLSDWIEHSETYTRKRNGSFQRLLPLSKFTQRPGNIKL